MAEKEELVQRVKLAEQAKRYDGMVASVKSNRDWNRIIQ